MVQATLFEWGTQEAKAVSRIGSIVGLLRSHVSDVHSTVIYLENEGTREVKGKVVSLFRCSIVGELLCASL